MAGKDTSNHLPLLTCDTCNQTKSNAEFNKRRDGSTYSNCKLCARAGEVQFWAGKQFKLCRDCETYKELRKYTFKDGVPYPTCTKCYASELTRKYHEKRDTNSSTTTAAAGVFNNDDGGAPNGRATRRWMGAGAEARWSCSRTQWSEPYSANSTRQRWQSLSGSRQADGKRKKASLELMKSLQDMLQCYTMPVNYY